MPGRNRIACSPLPEMLGNRCRTRWAERVLIHTAEGAALFRPTALAAFRSRAETTGKGYQTLINEALRSAITPENAPITVDVLRKVLREELRAA